MATSSIAKFFKSPNDVIELIYGVYQKSKLSNLPYYNFIGWFKEDPNA